MRIVFFTSHHFIAGTEKQKLWLRHSEFSSDIKKQCKLIFRNTKYNSNATVNCKYSKFRFRVVKSFFYDLGWSLLTGGSYLEVVVSPGLTFML
jgi:hypothetical protein